MITNDPLNAKLRSRLPVCPYCGSSAFWDDGKLLQREVSAWMCRRWPECDAYVGCHPGTRSPLGSLADPVLRQQRMHVHHRMDQLWRASGKTISRKQAYALVAAVLGRRSFHVGASRAEDIAAFEAAWPRMQQAAGQLMAQAAPVLDPGANLRLRQALLQVPGARKAGHLDSLVGPCTRP